jgi:hypothetical protein
MVRHFDVFWLWLFVLDFLGARPIFAIENNSQLQERTQNGLFS